MVRTLLCGAAVAALAGAASAEPTSFRVRSVEVRAAGRFVADPNGRQTPADCGRFRPSDAAVLRWFARSHEVGQPAWLEQGDFTSCRAEGRLVTADGKSYGWELDQGGRAQIRISPSVSVFLLGTAFHGAGRTGTADRTANRRPPSR